MFSGHSTEGFTGIVEGIRIKTLVYGEGTLMSKFLLAKGSKLPAHKHPHEQTGYLLGGRMILHIGAESRELAPGDSWCVPGNVEHRADVIEDSEAIEVFAPVREDYKKYFRS